MEGTEMELGFMLFGFFAGIAIVIVAIGWATRE
jgi:hypothetical protein